MKNKTRFLLLLLVVLAASHHTAINLQPRKNPPSSPRPHRLCFPQHPGHAVYDRPRPRLFS